MRSLKKIKKETKFDSIIVKLYEVKPEDISAIPVANIEAFENNNELIGDGGDGQVYRIDLKNGNIISSRLLK